jgi:hypothetical protein
MTSALKTAKVRCATSCHLPAPPVPHAPTLSLTLLAALLSLASSCLHAQEAAITTPTPWRVDLGVRSWYTQWDSWSINRVQVGGSLLQTVESLSARPTLALIPTLSARQGDWTLSTSVMTPASYTLRNATTAIQGSRSEMDVNVGKALLPGLTLSAGLKQLTQEAGGRFTWRGPVLGLAATAPLSDALSLYGHVGVGRMRLHTPGQDGDGQDRFNASYAVQEMGLAWGWPLAGAPAQHLTLALGMRAQTVRTSHYALLSQPASGGGTANVYAHDGLRDHTSGWSASLILSF